MSVSQVSTLIFNIMQDIRARHPDRPALIGVGGAQGSGKSFQCAAFAVTHPRVAHFSLDDVYLEKERRERRVAHYENPSPIPDDLFATVWPGLSREEYIRSHAAAAPLFLTRGPPGTHELGLATGLFARLGQPADTPLPRFDKLTDDRAPSSTWPVFTGPAAAILVDGWCMGAKPISDSPPINALEKEDTLGDWRAAARIALEKDYQHFFAAFDEIVYLQAPSWEVVRRWRAEQEENMLGRPMTPDEAAALDRFMQHYERITRAMLAGGHSAGWIVRLDDERNVIAIEHAK